MNSSAVGAHNYITWSSIEVVITRRTRNPLALRGPWVRIPPAPPKAKHPEGCFLLYGKSSLQRIPRKKTEKPIRGSIQVSSTNESGVCALALPFAWVLLDTWTVGKLKGKPFYVQTKGQLFPTCVSYAGYTHQREESPASLFLIAFLSSVLGLAFSSVFHRPILEEGRIEKWNSLMSPLSPALFSTADVEKGI